MGKDEDDEFIRFAKSGEMQAIRRLIKQDMHPADGDSAKAALRAAAKADKVAVVKVLVEWGVPLNCTDEVGKQIIHAAAEAGAVEVMEYLISADDKNKLDATGRSPIKYAMVHPHLPVCKELVRAGVKVSPEEARGVPGLAGVFREVQLENIAVELTKIAETRDVTDDILAIDGKVWELQWEHMRLVKTKEEQKAGKAFVESGKLREIQRQLLEQARANEDVLVGDIKEKRLLLLTAQTALTDSIRDLEVERVASESIVEEMAALDAEIDEAETAMHEAAKEKKESSEALAAKEKVKEELLERLRTAEAELAEVKARASALRGELRTARGELRGWQRDKEAAATLTAQAQALLGTGGRRG